MELKQLQYFQCVAKHENITRAAQELYISQSSLSQTISSLENELGVRLFDRAKGRIRLNGMGSAFLRTVDKVLFDLGSVKNELQTLRERIDRRLCIASTGSKALIPCIQEYYERYPDAEIDFTFMERPQIVEKLAAYELSLALVDKELSDRHVRTLFHAFQPICAMVHRRHPLAARDTLSLRELEGERVLINNQDFSKQDIMDICAAAGVRPKSISSSSDARMNDNLLRGHFGVQLIPYQDCLRLRGDTMETRRNACQEELTAVPIRDRVSHNTYLVAPDTQILNDALAAFLEIAGEHMDRLNAASEAFFRTCERSYAENG